MAITNTTKPDPISVGEILVLRAGFERHANNSEKMAATRKHARALINILDELLAHREKEGKHGE